MSNVVIACDPGGHGAFAVMIDGALVDVIDMPALTIKVGKTNRTRVDVDGVCMLLRDIMTLHTAPGDKLLFVMEDVGPMPKDGPTQAFNFGYHAAIPTTAAAMLGLPRVMVKPAEWKRKLKLRSDKDEARKRAMEMWPGFARKFSRKKDDGRAEAALLAHWALQHGDA